MKCPKLLSICTLFLTVFLLTACGKGDDQPAAAAVAAANVCQAGYGHHASYGCLPQSYCPVGQGLYQNQCFPVAQTVNPGNCPSGYSWNGSSCVVGGSTTGDRCSSHYPGTYESSPGWCSCLPGLRPQSNGCY